MKKINLFTAATLMFAVVFTTADVHAAVPCNDTKMLTAAQSGYTPYVSVNTANMDMQTSEPCAYIPYASVEYAYSDSVTCGTVRYIGQNTASTQYNASYWGTHSANSECLTANISMALSYVGANVTPKAILDYSTSTTWKRNWGGITSYAETTLDVAMSNYINGVGKYSPPIIHLTGENCGYTRGHYVLVVGKISDTQYQVLDPYCDAYNPPLWQVSIADGVVSYTLSAGSRICSSPLSSAYQYYNENAVIGQQTAADTVAEETPQDQTPATIEGAEYPTSLVEGQAFSIKGIINSTTTISNVTLLVTKSSGETAISVIAEPNSTSYDIFTGMDNSVAFGTLCAGKYTYTVKATNDGGEITLVSEVFTILPKATAITSMTNCQAGINLKWQMIASATGYYIFRRAGSGQYELLADVPGATSTAFVDTTTKDNTRYAYKVYAYKDDAGERMNSAPSPGKACFKLARPASVKLKKLSSKSISVTYKKAAKASNYQIQYSTSKKFTGAKIVTLKGNSRTIKSLKKGKTYYVRVRTCYKSGGVIYRSAWSDVKSIKLK